MKKRIVVFLASLMCISLCACGGTESTGGNNANTQKEESGGLFKTEKEIEITMDNWQEYFEEKEVLSLKYNAFDEIEDICFYKILALKEGITIDPYKSNVAIEANTHIEHYYVNIDTDTWDFEFEERKGDFEHAPTSKIKEFFTHTYEQGEYYSVEFYTVAENYVGTEKETERTFVERYFIDEIIRIKGTLTVIE